MNSEMKPEARVIIYLVRGARVSLGEENNRLAATVVWGAQSFGQKLRERRNRPIS